MNPKSEDKPCQATSSRMVLRKPAHIRKGGSHNEEGHIDLNILKSEYNPDHMDTCRGFWSLLQGGEFRVHGQGIRILEFRAVHRMPDRIATP